MTDRLTHLREVPRRQTYVVRSRSGVDYSITPPDDTDVLFVCDDGTPVLLHRVCGCDYAGNRECPSCMARRLAAFDPPELRGGRQ